MKDEKLTKEQREFMAIRDKLKKFNEEEKKSHISKTVLRIDYEFIYDIPNTEVTDYDLRLGKNILRKVNEPEMKDILHDYAVESFNIKLNRAMSFSNMINALTEKIREINNDEEDDFLKDEYQSDDRLFSTNDLLHACEMVLGKIDSTDKPKKETLKALSNATINIDMSNDKKDCGFGGGEIIKLTSDEINKIFDPSFVLGC